MGLGHKALQQVKKAAIHLGLQMDRRFFYMPADGSL